MAGITVGLYGGLGNQLFQYAVGLSLALRYDLPLSFDSYGFEFDRHYRRKCGLGGFDVGELRFTRCPVRFKTARVLRYLVQRMPLAQTLSSPWFVIERLGRGCDGPPIISECNSVYLMGYWQDERYFLPAKHELKRRLSPKNGLSDINSGILRKIEGTDSVAVHCRRLHTVGVASKAESVPDAERLGIAVGSSYYTAAFDRLDEKIARPHFFVFSDEPVWARQNLRSPHPITFLEPGRGADLEDMFLMSRCRHHIICNSSFSWWGAWLAENIDQVVVAPSNVQYLPEIPARWIQICGQSIPLLP